LTANEYSQGDIEGLSDYGTRRLIASTVFTESNGGDLSIANTAGYIGRYQAGATWLADAGYVDTAKLHDAMSGYKREWRWAESGGMTRFLEDPSNWKEGLTLEKYKASAELQDQAFKRNSDAAYRTAVKQGVLHPGDSEEHIAGFLKARHIAGYGGAVGVVKNGQTSTDDYGTSSLDYYNDIAINRDGLNQLFVIEEKFKGIPYKLPVEKELKPGETSLSVKALQENLQLVGATDASGRALQPDGNYGRNTREAVANFQQLNNLPETGTADIATLSALHTRAAIATSAPDFQQVTQRLQPPGYRNDWMQTNEQGLPNYLQARTPTATHAPTRDTKPDGVLKIGEHDPEVAKLQESLIELGINDRLKNPIKADGIFGPDTQRAVQAFQLWHGIEHINGVADKQTLAAINTQAGLAIVQRAVDKATDHPVRDFAANTTLGTRIDGASAADLRDSAEPSRHPVPNAPAESANPSPNSASGAHTAPDTIRLSREDQAMFDKIRTGSPAHVTDEKVAQAVLAAKQNGITDAERIGPIGVSQDKLWIGGVTPGYHTGVSLSEPSPPMRDTLREVHALNEQQAQKIDTTPRSPDDPTRGGR
jgi:peptidoglycan hydrolase-like protein with peptidoglycan-binding domain